MLAGVPGGIGAGFIVGWEWLKLEQRLREQADKPESPDPGEAPTDPPP